MPERRFTQSDLYGPSGRPQPQDIRQDDLNDCYFLAPLGGLARAQPQRLRDAIVYDAKTEAFQVTLYRPGGVEGPQPVVIVVDQNDIADNLDRMGGSTVDNDPGQNGPVWPAVMEAAYAELQGRDDRDKNYAAIDMGHPSSALYALTGHPGENLDPAALAAEGAQGVFDRLSGALREGRPVTVGTFRQRPGTAPDGLMEPHMYMVEGVRMQSGDVLLDLRNPYAHNRAGEGRDSASATMTVSLASVTREGMPGLYLNIGPAPAAQQRGQPSHEAGHAIASTASREGSAPATGNLHVDALLAGLGDPGALKQAMQALYDSAEGRAIRAGNRAAYEAQAESREAQAMQPQAPSMDTAAPVVRR